MAKPKMTIGNVRVYVKTPGASPTAFAATDQVPAALLVDNIPVTQSASTMDFQTWASSAISRIVNQKDSTINLSVVLDPADDSAATWFQAVGVEKDVLVVIGDVPAAGAKNLVLYGRYVVTSMETPNAIDGFLRADIQMTLSEGSTLTTAANVTAFPSL